MLHWKAVRALSLFLTCWRRAGRRYRPHRQPQLRLGWVLQVAGQSGRWLSSLLYQTSWGRIEGLGIGGRWSGEKRMNLHLEEA